MMSVVEESGQGGRYPLSGYFLRRWPILVVKIKMKAEFKDGCSPGRPLLLATKR